MIELEAITTAVNDIGFPIVAFLLMFWLCTKIIKENTKAIQGLTIAIERSNHTNPTSTPYQQPTDKYRKP